jgi:hypothetical protein
MSGYLRTGSSLGRGLKMILELDFVSEITFSASATMVNSFGFPIFIGPITSSGVHSSLMRALPRETLKNPVSLSSYRRL